MASMTLKSKSKNWRLPHNKYNYPSIPIEQSKMFGSVYKQATQASRK